MIYALLGGDKRQAELARQLALDGHDVRTWGIKDSAYGGTRSCEDWIDALSGADIVVLPLPAERGKNINTVGESCVLPTEEMLGSIGKESLLLGGKMSRVSREKADEMGVRTEDYYECEELVIANAAITAEGAVQILMNESERTISGMKCLVAGGGRIGKFLAQKLRALGADVVVTVRKTEDMVALREFGYKCADTGDIENIVGEFDAVLNTVPAVVFGKKELEKVKRDAVIMELASEPGGFDTGSAEKLGIRIVKALSLPGKTAPVSAASAIKDTIYNIIGKEKKPDE